MFYRQAIALFGIVLPLIAAIALIGGGYVLKSKMVESFNIKQRNSRTYETGRMAGLEVEKEVTQQHPHIERWKALLSEETASSATNNLREISEHLPGKEIQQTAFERIGTVGGFGSVSAQGSTQIRIAFRGTFRTLQKAFLELETRMPQLQLTEFHIDPSSNQSTLLNFQVTYTAWEN